MTDIVRLEGVTKVYQDGKVAVPALRGIDLVLEKGEFVAVAGPSGSGKTTLLNIIGGLDKPTQGSVYLEDKRLSTMTRGELSRLRLNRIGFIFQSYNLIPVLTAFENAEFVLLLQKQPAEERRQRVVNLLEEVGLSGLENRFPRDMSGGQQQRVAVARALYQDATMLLGDEPVSALDEPASHLVLQTMSEYYDTVVLAMHDVRLALQYTTRVIGIHNGAIAIDAASSDVTPVELTRFYSS